MAPPFPSELPFTKVTFLITTSLEVILKTLLKWFASIVFPLPSIVIGLLITIPPLPNALSTLEL